MHYGPMDAVINHLRNGHVVEAIKTFRNEYHCSLVEAKNACEAIRDAMNAKARNPAGTAGPSHGVFVRTSHSADYSFVGSWSEAEARTDADRFCAEGHEDDVFLVRVIARSQRTLAMKDVA